MLLGDSGPDGFTGAAAGFRTGAAAAGACLGFLGQKREINKKRLQSSLFLYGLGDGLLRINTQWSIVLQIYDLSPFVGSSHWYSLRFSTSVRWS